MGANGDGNETQTADSEVSTFISPINYYEQKSKTRPPRSIQDFLENNYQVLAIAGIFAALVVYLSDLATSPGRQIFIGMVGGALLFLISFLIVIHNVSIEFSRAYEQKSLILASLYSCIFFAMLFITISLVSFFSNYPVAYRAVDTLVALETVVIYVLIISGRFSLSILNEEYPNYNLNLGRITGFIARKSLKIAATILVLSWAFLDFFGAPFGLPSQSNSQFLSVLFPVICIFVMTGVVLLTAVLSRFIFLWSRSGIQLVKSRLI